MQVAIDQAAAKWDDAWEGPQLPPDPSNPASISALDLMVPPPFGARLLSAQCTTWNAKCLDAHCMASALQAGSGWRPHPLEGRRKASYARTHQEECMHVQSWPAAAAAQQPLVDLRGVVRCCTDRSNHSACAGTHGIGAFMSAAVAARRFGCLQQLREEGLSACSRHAIHARGCSLVPSGLGCG